MFDSREIGLRLTEKRRMRLCKAEGQQQTLPDCDCDYERDKRTADRINLRERNFDVDE